MVKRNAAKQMASQLPRTITLISSMLLTRWRQELVDFLQAHPELLETILFVCKSGMLLEVAEDLRREHWLPPSNKYFHNVSQAFYATALSLMQPVATIQLLQKLTNADPDVIWKLLFLATGTHKQSRVPSLHKLSFFRLLTERHVSLGERLASVDWDAAAAGEEIDWEKVGIYTKIKDGEEIVGFQHVGGEKVMLKRNCGCHMVLKRNWSERDAVLVDPKDEEDDVMLRKRFRSVIPDIMDWSKAEIEKAEAACNVDAVKLSKDDEHYGEDAEPAASSTKKH